MSARQEVDLSALRVLRSKYVTFFFDGHVLLECHPFPVGWSLGCGEIISFDSGHCSTFGTFDLLCIHQQILTASVVNEGSGLDRPRITLNVADFNRLLRSRSFV